MTEDELLEKIRTRPEEVEFEEVVGVIDRYYHYRPVRFRNGLDDRQIVNEPGRNEGSCKIFAFALRHGLTVPQTLACFGRHYREDVLGGGEGHANIRAFMRDGWEGVAFEQDPLLRVN